MLCGYIWFWILCIKESKEVFENISEYNFCWFSVLCIVIPLSNYFFSETVLLTFIKLIISNKFKSYLTCYKRWRVVLQYAVTVLWYSMKEVQQKKPKHSQWSLHRSSRFIAGSQQILTEPKVCHISYNQQLYLEITVFQFLTLRINNSAHVK